MMRLAGGSPSPLSSLYRGGVPDRKAISTPPKVSIQLAECPSLFPPLTIARQTDDRHPA